MSGPHWKIHCSPGRWQAVPITKTGWIHLIIWIVVFTLLHLALCAWLVLTNASLLSFFALMTVITVFSILGLVWFIKRNA